MKRKLALLSYFYDRPKPHANLLFVTLNSYDWSNHCSIQYQMPPGMHYKCWQQSLLTASLRSYSNAARADMTLRGSVQQLPQIHLLRCTSKPNLASKVTILPVNRPEPTLACAGLRRYSQGVTAMTVTNRPANKIFESASTAIS